MNSNRTITAAVMIVWGAAFSSLAQQSQQATSAATSAATRSSTPSGVCFVAEWKFEEPLRFWSDGSWVEAREGYYVGLVVNPSDFVPQNAPAPQVFAGKTAGHVYYGAAPAALDGSTNFIVLRIPKIDLKEARFWIGPRVLEEHLSSKLVDAARAAADADNRISPAISTESLGQAKNRVTAGQVQTSHQAMMDAVRAYRESKTADRSVIRFGEVR